MPAPTISSAVLQDDGRYLVTLSDGATFYTGLGSAEEISLLEQLLSQAGDPATTPVTLTDKLAGEDLTNDVLRVEQQGSPFAINTATTTIVSAVPGHLYRLRAIGGTLGGVTVYNNNAASGAVLLPTVTPLANGVLLEDIDFSIGLTIVTAAATVVVGSFR
jgi:hypothetical protein